VQTYRITAVGAGAGAADSVANSCLGTTPAGCKAHAALAWALSFSLSHGWGLEQRAESRVPLVVSPTLLAVMEKLEVLEAETRVRAEAATATTAWASIVDCPDGGCLCEWVWVGRE
jgi:hypothetical protein